MSWAGLASNQTISFTNLRNAQTTGVFPTVTTAPISSEQVTKSEVPTYVVINTGFPTFASKSSNQLVVKSNLNAVPSGVWSTGGAMVTAQFSHGGAGTQNSALLFGGQGPGCTCCSCTQQYNGTTWGGTASMNNGRRSLGGAGEGPGGCCGSLAFGGYCGGVAVNNTEEFVGGSWSTSGGLSISRFGLSGAGTVNSALAFGGGSPPTFFGQCTEEYNGTSWRSGGALLACAGTYGAGGAGSQNAALSAGGTNYYLNTQEYDGTTWSFGNSLSVPRYLLAASGYQNAGLAFGGQCFFPSTSRLSCTEEYNGVSWSTGGVLSVARERLAGAGFQNAALAFGGVNTAGVAVSCTEEYTK